MRDWSERVGLFCFFAWWNCVTAFRKMNFLRLANSFPIGCKAPLFSSAGWVSKTFRQESGQCSPRFLDGCRPCATDIPKRPSCSSPLPWVFRASQCRGLCCVRFLLPKIPCLSEDGKLICNLHGRARNNREWKWPCGICAKQCRATLANVWHSRGNGILWKTDISSPSSRALCFCLWFAAWCGCAVRVWKCLSWRMKCVAKVQKFVFQIEKAYFCNEIVINGNSRFIR